MKFYYFKKLFDLLISIVLLIILFPLIFFISVIILFSIGSPILFKQKRPGKNGEIFKIYKFRTMKNTKDKSGNLLPDKLRQTRFGNFLRRASLDEIPELLNVIKGEMSLVGPRPLMISYLELYNDFQARRHEVLPGITGWAQVNGRNKISWEEKFKLDVWYIDNWSLILDLKIIYITIIKVFMMKDINQTSDVSMDPFLGEKTK
ncbi:MAG: hypothetical protein CMF54_07795 [Legionellales bacterium]|nr:hypothetical protein [Legionellales bacterium]|tara:strand:+ start:1503 stop:2114 length:612 start_codon:yes stop_codon:yes gene_type:complete